MAELVEPMRRRVFRFFGLPRRRYRRWDRDGVSLQNGQRVQVLAMGRRGGVGWGGARKANTISGDAELRSR